MPVDLRIDLVGRSGNPIRNPRTVLERVRRKAVPFAMKAALDMIAADLKVELVRQWQRDLPDARRKRTFPKNVIRVRRSFVSRQGLVTRPARVFSAAGNDVIRLQTRGGIRKPHGRSLFIPSSGRRVRKGDRNYRAGPYLFRYTKRTKGDGTYAAVFAKRAKYRPRYKVRAALARTARKAPRIAFNEFARELENALERAT